MTEKYYCDYPKEPIGGVKKLYNFKFGEEE